VYTDKTLTCRECGQEFTFSAGEQEFYASHGLQNEPTRCPSCRAARRASRNDGDWSGNYGAGDGYARRERQLFSAVCSSCGKEALVPFQPRGDRPVYCSDCFALQRAGAEPRVSRW
jgi:CxxC-x17-CxxC domain-containing protein